MGTAFEVIQKTAERALLVGIVLPGRRKIDEEESLEELRKLTEAAGATVVAMELQVKKTVNPAYAIGAGKAREFKQMIKDRKINLVVFDEDLTPAQGKNLEALLEEPVTDRSGIILDIFARRARSPQARLQVAIAQLKYQLPRLTRQWQHLERQDGSYGTRGGPGEKQLELDRRMARKRISDLSKELEKVQKRTAVESARRATTFRVALVGYTNSGKSTLFNRLVTHGDVIERDQLFTTLDTTIRKITTESGKDIIVSDTVGFIGKLPADLLDAFHSTLHEAIEADLILHVIDVTCQKVKERIEMVNNVLSGLGANYKNIVRVFNKIDEVAPENGLLKKLHSAYPEALLTSALHGDGVASVHTLIEQFAEASSQEITLHCPIDRLGDLAQVYTYGRVLKRTDDEQGSIVVVRASTSDIARFKQAGLHEV